MIFPITGEICDACETRMSCNSCTPSMLRGFVKLLPDIWWICRMADREL